MSEPPAVDELVLPHRLLGLLDDVRLVGGTPERPRPVGATSLRQPEAYSGIAREDGVLIEATSTSWDHVVDRYTLEVVGR